MIVGIGCDIVEHETTQKLGWEYNISIQNRIFSTKELNLCPPHKKIIFLSGRFAAKEAVLKCLGTGMEDGIALTDIQTVQSENGAPIIEISGELQKLADAMGIIAWHISITHSNKHSIAMVVAEK